MSSKRRVHIRPLIAAAGLVVLVALCFFFWYCAPTMVESSIEVYQYASLALFPSGEKAYQYGEDHFDASLLPQAYNISLAEYFYYRAAKLDPKLPYVWHELARISFIQGDFPKAMAQINLQISQEGDQTPPSYYVRALIEGYMGNYAASEKDYAKFLSMEPHNWAGLNDFAWVLLKDGKPAQAQIITSIGLQYYPDNAWLLNSSATAFYELGLMPEARIRIIEAEKAVQNLTPELWSLSYPGNSPESAVQGIASFKQAVADNMHSILGTTTPDAQ